MSTPNPANARSKSALARSARAAAGGRRLSTSSSTPAMPYRIRGDPYRPPVEGVIDNLDKRKGPQRLNLLSKELSPLEGLDPKAKTVTHHPNWSWPATGAWQNFSPVANRLIEDSFIDGERVCRIWDNAQGGGIMLREFDLDNKLVMPGFKELRRDFRSEYPPVEPPPEVVRPKYSGGPIKPSQCFKWRVGKSVEMRKFAATPPAVTERQARLSAMAYWAGLTPKERPQEGPKEVFQRPDGWETQEAPGWPGDAPSPKSTKGILTPGAGNSHKSLSVSFK